MGAISNNVADVSVDNAFGTKRYFVTTLSQPSDNPMLVSIIWPEMSAVRGASHLLRIDAFLALKNRSADRCKRDIESMLATAEHCSQRNGSFADLTAFAILNSTTEVIGHVLYQAPEFLDEQFLIELSHRLASIRGGGRLRLNLQSQRDMFEDMLQRMYTDDGSGDGHLTFEGAKLLAELQSQFGRTSALSGRALLPALAMIEAGRRESLKRYDEVMAIVQRNRDLSLWQWSAESENSTQQAIDAISSSRLRYAALPIFVPSLYRAAFLAELANQRRDASLTAIALELYRRKHTEYPASLSELAPRYLPVVPPDRFDGKPLKYRLENGKAVLYSVGADRHDDGGHWPGPSPVPRSCHLVHEWCFPDKVNEALNNKAIVAGDWVLWPPMEE